MVGNWLSVIIPHLYEVGITEKSKFRARRRAAATIMVGMLFRAIPHNFKCRYGERGAADAKPKAQIILDAAKVSAASGGNSEPKQGQRSQSARGFCPRSTMRVPQPDIIEHFGNADAVPQLPERCLSRKAGIMRYCLRCQTHPSDKRRIRRAGWCLRRCRGWSRTRNHCRAGWRSAGCRPGQQWPGRTG